MCKERLSLENIHKIKGLAGLKKETITSKIVFKAALAGDQKAQQICEEISDYFALGIGIISNLLNPSKILIGGGVSLTGDYSFDLIQEKR